MGLIARSIPGVVASLKKKGAITCVDVSKFENGQYAAHMILNQEGFEAYQKAKEKKPAEAGHVMLVAPETDKTKAATPVVAPKEAPVATKGRIKYLKAKAKGKGLNDAEKAELASWSLRVSSGRATVADIIAAQ